MSQFHTNEPFFLQKNPQGTRSRLHEAPVFSRRRVFRCSWGTSIRATCFAFSPQSIVTRSPPLGVSLEAHQRFCGGLLGDGFLEIQRNSKTDEVVGVWYREKHSAAQAYFVFNQQRALRPFPEKMKTPAIQQDKRNYSFFEVRTARTFSFKIYGEAFYRSEKTDGKWRNKKQVPDTIGE